ncbi:MAG TPA: YdeI/OmpD-associated family protein, partial [Gemmatimonadaceae bacterium]|nr:YdeI/OmpD-associated family protein [Gemmatimonadaceae bacterium]
SAEFARPILDHIRDVIHQAIPDVEEDIKWGAPFFNYEGVICGIAAFKEHCAINLWKASLIVGEKRGESAGQFGRITKLSDLPSDKALKGLFKQAARLNETGVKQPREKKKTAPVVVPPELQQALKANKKAAAAFEKFPPSHKREYAQWIAEAKGEDTRARRVSTAIEWIAEGKGRNWKYEKR